MLVALFSVHNILFLFFFRLKLYYDHGEIKRYNGKRRMGDLKAFVDKFAVTSEVRCSKTARGGTPYNGLYGEAPPERGTFFRL